MERELSRVEPAEKRGTPSALLGFILGGAVALALSVSFRAYLRSRPFFTRDGDLGEIRISREAMRDLIESYCQGVEGINAVSVDARRRGPRAIVELELSVAADADIAGAVGELVSTLYRKTDELLGLQPGGMTVVLGDISVS